VLESGVRVWIRIRVRVRVKDAYGTKRLGTKRLAYEMSGSRYHCSVLKHHNSSFIVLPAPKI